MAGNPRIDELRKKVEKDPGSRLFAQLAEELRKDGDLAEAVRVAREGLEKHPNYPSARMTLGRGLLDSGDFTSARTEFEQVVKGAPDNILASRFLAECLEKLGDVPGAITRYKATLLLAPGDKQILARLDALAGAAPAASAPAAAVPAAVPAPVVPPAAAAAAPAAPSAAVASSPSVAPAASVAPATEPPPVAADPPPIPLSAADDAFEIERPYEAPVRGPGDAAPTAPAAPVEFEMESAHEAPSAQWGAPSAAPVEPAAPPEAAFAPEPAPSATTAEPVVEDQEFEMAPPSAEGGAAAAPTFRNDLLAEGAREAGLTHAPAPFGSEPPSSAPTPPQAVASPTLAELYVNQGFVDKAVEVYQEIIQRDPANEKAAQRLAELGEAGAPADPLAERRRKVEQTIARLEGFLAAVKRG